jgi:hypothetical protein
MDKNKFESEVEVLKSFFWNLLCRTRTSAEEVYELYIYASRVYV